MSMPKKGVFSKILHPHEEPDFEALDSHQRERKGPERAPNEGSKIDAEKPKADLKSVEQQPSQASDNSDKHQLKKFDKFKRGNR